MLPHGQNIIEKNAYGVPVGRKGAASTAVRAKFAKTDFRESSGRKVLPHGQNIIEKTAYGVPIGRKDAASTAVRAKFAKTDFRESNGRKLERESGTYIRYASISQRKLTNQSTYKIGFYPIHAGNIARKDV